MFSKIIFWFLIIIAVIQFIPVDRENPPVQQKDNFVSLNNTPQNIRTILKKACYDCHSNETIYPDYAVVAPISWSVRHHVEEGRGHLNFSVWGTYNKELKESMLKNAESSVKDFTMPMPGYVAYHPEANLTSAERKILTDYFQKIRLGGKL